jgi:hypothetical protein
MASTKDTANLPVDRLCRKLLGNKSRLTGWLLIAISTTELTLMSNEVAGQKVAEKAAHGLTCNLDGIPAQERARYTELFESLCHAIRDKRELPDGYALLLDAAQFIKHSSGQSSNESAAHSSRRRFVGISRTDPYGLI